MKLFVSLLLNFALPLALLQAPSSHVHAHEVNEQHQGVFLHTHAGHRDTPPSGQAEFKDFDPDDDAQFLNLASMLRNHEGVAPAISIAQSVTIPAPGAAFWQMAALRPNAHDPPSLNSIGPRAPPLSIPCA